MGARRVPRRRSGRRPPSVLLLVAWVAACRPDVRNPNGYCRADADCAAPRRCVENRCTEPAPPPDLSIPPDLAPPRDLAMFSCDACGGTTPACKGDRCECAGARDSDSCLADGKVCVAGACVACSRSDQCPAAQCCAGGRCTGTPAWTEIKDAQGTPPSPRSAHTALFDEAGDRMVVYGGRDEKLQNLPQSALFTLTLASPMTWSNVAGASEPAPRSAVAMAQDGNDVLLFGGALDNGAYDPDVWRLVVGPGVVWTRAKTSGSAPPRRSAASLVRRPVGLVLFGGYPADGHGDDYDAQRMMGPVAYKDVWSLSLPGLAWQKLTPADGPAPRLYTVAAYDPPASRLVVYGGQNAFRELRDLWQLDLSVDPPLWKELTADAGTAPPSGYGHLAVHDAQNRRLIVYGGRLGNGQTSRVFSLDLVTNTWSEIAARGTPPPGREAAAAIYDGKRQRMVLFGGGVGVTGQSNVASVVSDLWELSLPACGP